MKPPKEPKMLCTRCRKSIPYMKWIENSGSCDECKGDNYANQSKKTARFVAKRQQRVQAKEASAPTDANELPDDATIIDP